MSLGSPRTKTRSEQLVELVECLYRAAVDPEHWSEFALALARAFDGSPVNIFLRVPATGVDSRSYRALLDEALQPIFDRHIREGLPWGSESRPELLDGFLPIEHLLDGKKLAQTALYREWMEPNGLAPISPMIHVLADYDGHAVGAVGLHRRLGMGPFSPEEIEFAGRLVPHLKRAWSIYRRLDRLARQQSVLDEVINELPTGILLLDQHGRVLRTNNAARRTIERGQPLQIRTGEPHAQDEETDAALQQMIQRAIDPDAFTDANVGMSVTIPYPDAHGKIFAFAAPLTSRDEGRLDPHEAAVLYLGDPELLHDVSRDALRSLYGLTPAECELAGLLAEGFSLVDAARKRRVTEHTARSQLKQIFAKTGTGRQAELVRLVLGTIQPPVGQF